VNTLEPNASAPGGSASSRILLVASAGAFASSLAASIVGVALPKIGAWAGAGVLDVGWVMLAPLVAITAALLPAGRAGDLWGHRRVYVSGVAIAAAGCVASALSPSFESLLAARALTGIGAAMCMATAPALVSLSAPPGRRGRALGAVSTAVYLGLTVGPPLGGLIETTLGFRAVFWAQVAVFGAILVASVRWMPDLPRRPDAETGRFDALAALLLGLALSGLMLAATRWDRWDLHATLAAGGGGLAAMAAFAVREARSSSPVLVLGLFRDRTFASAAAGALLNYVSVLHATFLLPFLLEDGMGLPAREAGLVLVGMPLAMTLVTGTSGALSDRLGSRVLSSAGMLISALALCGLALAPGGLPIIVAWTCLLGVGAGVFISPNTNALMSAAPPGKQGAAAGIMALARNAGMLVGTASAAAVFDAGRAVAAAGAADTGAAAGYGVRLACGVGALIALVGAAVVLTRPASASR